ncbi:putative 3-methyladenine DNA glycosylase [Trichinella spiralis]|uniref:3-methyladenine DNA glycosylase n=1 Tax=Trichinella spiralis TaxID=6334 RepID=A0ABR3KYG2_TRISP
MVNQAIRLIDKSELENVLLSQLTLSSRVTRTVRLAVWMSPILSVTFPAPGHCVTCFNHRTRPVGNPNGSPAHAKKQELHLR